MKKIVILFGVMVSLMAMACRKENTLQKLDGGSLAGTKWIGTDWDYGIGDDWATIYDETIDWYC